jgi:hypothetical protein
VNLLINYINKILRYRGYKIKRLKKPVLQESQIFSIGIYEGDSPLSLNPYKQVDNPVVTADLVSDVKAMFVADPFMVYVDNIWYMFFEVMNLKTQKGEIGLAISNNLHTWRYERIVLNEPFHLSYPYVFIWNDNYYMIPETGQTRTVRLYKASDFPYKWKFIETLMSGEIFLDVSPFYYKGYWWLYAETNPRLKFDTLRLYFARDIFGPWCEHPRSPIINGDSSIARPAGRVISIGDTLFRYSQDCSKVYGKHVSVSKVTLLNETEYQEELANIKPILKSGKSGWNGGGMHHIDLHVIEENDRWIACVDGWYMGIYL